MFYLANKNVLNKMPELEQKIFQKRQVAYKVRICNVLSGNFTKDDLSAGYLKLKDIHISRINIIATIVYKYEQTSSHNSAVIDDGTGRISLRSFESGAFSKVDVGDVVLVIGRIREFSDEKYVIPEILKKINNVDWINVRKLELKKYNYAVDEIKIADDVAEKTTDDFKINSEMYSLIKELDKGNGVSVEDIIKKFDNSEAESVINKLLENGDIFEIKPGRLKVLE